MPFKITRPEGSARQFFCGFALKPEQSIYIDMQEAANHFLLRANWFVEEVEQVAPDYTPPASLLDKEGKPPDWMKDGVISVLKCPTLKTLLREEVMHIEEAPKGQWEVYAKPDDWTNPFFYGFDTRKLPFKLDDYRVVKQFAARGFQIRDAKSRKPLRVEPVDADLMGGIQVKPGRLLTTTDFEEETKV